MTAIHDPMPGPDLDQLTGLTPTPEELVSRLREAALIADRQGWVQISWWLTSLAADLDPHDVYDGDRAGLDRIAAAILAPEPVEVSHV